MIEHIAGLKTAKSHGAERASADLLGLRANDVADSRIAAARTVADLKLGHEVGLVVAAAAVLGVALGAAGLAPGDIVLLLLLFLRVAPRLSGMQQSWSQVAQMLPTFASVTDLHAHFQAVAEAEPAAEEPAVLSRRITVEAASFSYLPGRARAALVDVDVVIPAGSTTAVVGRSGSGKTTLADLVCGLLAPTDGRVLLDGRALEAGLARAWRCQVGYVGQEPFLLHDTVRAYVSWGRPGAVDAEVLDGAGAGVGGRVRGRAARRARHRGGRPGGAARRRRAPILVVAPAGPRCATPT